MKRRIALSDAAVVIVLILTLSAMVWRTRSDARRIADLEERNAALSRLCGPDPTRDPYVPAH